MISSRVKKNVLSAIKPTKREETQIHKTVLYLIDVLEKQAQDQGVDVDFYIGGSFGKGTYLRDNFDVDIFCRFSQKYHDTQLSDLLENIVKEQLISYKKEKGSRDYFSGTFSHNTIKISFELVPTRRISTIDEGINSTDYSFLHVEYVVNSISKYPHLADEIRLAKSLFKAQGFYGAESYINGFSGHTIDLLILYYGSLEMLLQDANNWGCTKVIDVANHYSSQNEIYEKIDRSKHSSLLLVDAIVPQRNAAKALSNDVYGNFLVWVYQLDELEYEDFMKKPKSLKKLLEEEYQYAQTNGFKPIFYKLTCSSIKSEDITGAKIKKLFEKIQKRFEYYDFEIFKSRFIVSSDFLEAYYIYHCSQTQIPKKKWMKGPTIEMRESVEAVLKKTKDYEVKNGILWYVLDRNITHIEDLEEITLEDCKELMNSSIEFIDTFSKL